jgi:hypothetical protein
MTPEMYEMPKDIFLLWAGQEPFFEHRCICKKCGDARKMQTARIETKP